MLFRLDYVATQLHHMASGTRQSAELGYAHVMKTQLAICLCVLLACVSCGIFDSDDDDGSSGCRKVTINKQLKHVFYWGTTDGINMVPNVGYTSGGIDEPTWIDPATILVFTGTFVGDDFARGLFKINIDEQTLSYKDYEVFEFPFYIYSIAYQADTGRLLIVYYDGNPIVAEVSLSGGKVVIEGELVGSEWSPLGVSPCGASEDIVFYGRRPDDGVWGYFRRTWSGSQATDSLLLNFTHNSSDDAMQKFAVDDAGAFLYFGSTTLTREDFNMRVLRLNLQTNAPLDTILTRSRGSAISLRPNPQDSDLLLVQYFFFGGGHDYPDGKVLLLDMQTGATKSFNVRTHEALCRFTSNENVFWSPDGLHFVFSADAFDGEGGYYQRELWVYRNAR
jgi:hypothetical protein